MRLWSWVYHKGSSVGSATTVVNRGTKLQSVGVVVKHHAPTEDSHINKLPQDHRSLRKINKKVNFNLCRVTCILVCVLWLESQILGKVAIVCRQFAKGNWAGMKTRKINNEKTDRLQRSNWNDNRFERG